VFFETTACVTYAFHATYRFAGVPGVLKSVGNEIVSEFLGFCKREKISLCITETVREEGLSKLPEIVNRYFDRARIRSPTVRESVFIKLRTRYTQLAALSKFDIVESDLAKVSALYTSFLKNPELRARLIKLKEKKPTRKGLLPSQTDIQILGEAVTLNLKNRVCFVTDDDDYIFFKNEIKQNLGVDIIELLELRSFAQTLISRHK